MVGPYRIETLVNAFDNLRKMYGNIVRLNHGQEAVLLFDPDDIRTMYALLATEKNGIIIDKSLWIFSKEFEKQRQLCPSDLAGNVAIKMMHHSEEAMVSSSDLSTTKGPYELLQSWNRSSRMSIDFNEIRRPRRNQMLRP